MNFRTSLVFATAFVAVVGSTAAFAAEGEQDSTWITPSTLSRAAVRAEAAPAGGEASFTVVAASSSSMLSRVQVQAEAREALRLGLLPTHEGTRMASAAELAQIRMAGLRAVENATVVAGR